MDTVSTTTSEVPAYLQSGEFYRSLNDDEDHYQQINIPSNTLKADTTVRNNVDLHYLLTSLRFWGVSSVQEEVIKYCLSALESPCGDILLEFAQDFPYILILKSVLSAGEDDKVMIAVVSGVLEIVRNLPAHLTVTVNCCSVAARAGNLEILQCLHERGGNMITKVLHAALEGGDKSLACMQYLRAQGVEWPDGALVTALKAGSKECFQYALQDGCLWENYRYYALCDDKYVDALKYAVQHGCPVNDYLAEDAAANGAIRCLQVLHEVNCPWDEDACTEAAENGHLDCLQYLHESGCPWSRNTVLQAVKGNHVDCLQYLLQQGCPPHWLSGTIAATAGFLSILQCLHQAGVPWDAQTCTDTACNGHLDCLQYLHENGCPWNERTFRRTLECEQLECLKYLMENGCPIDMKECQEAIKESRYSQEAVEIVRSFHALLMATSY